MATNPYFQKYLPTCSFSIGRSHPFIGHEGPQGEQRYSSTLFLTSALEGVRGQRHASAAPYPRERPGTHCTGGWVGLRTGLDWCVKSRLHRDSIPGPSSPQAVAIPTTLPGPFSIYPRCYYETNNECICPSVFNHLTPNGHYMGRTAQLTSRCCIVYIYSTNIRT